MPALYTLYMFIFPISPGGSASSDSTRSQVVPEFDERFSVLPDELVTLQDVPTVGQSKKVDGT